MQRSKANNEGFRSKSRQKLINRKNISDGRIKLNVAENDKVPEDYQIDYKDNPFDTLDLNPNRTTSYIESKNPLILYDSYHMLRLKEQRI